MIAGATFAVQAVGTLALLAAGSGSVPLLLLGCTLFGCGVGNLLSLPPLIAATEFAPADVARIIALVTSVNQASYACAPGLLGALRDLTSGPPVPLVVTGLVQVAAALFVLAGRGARRTTAFAFRREGSDLALATGRSDPSQPD